MTKKLTTCRKLLANRTSPGNMHYVASIMSAHLKNIEIQRPDSWFHEAWACLDILIEALEHEQQRTMPEMACQRSGRCCAKQVPRVSLFEAHRIAEWIGHDPVLKEQLQNTCQEATTKKYDNAVLGTGVACPMLKKNDDGVHICTVHGRRPLICHLASVSTALSWDCPIWKVHQNRFPVLDKDLVRPLLALFSECRQLYCLKFLGRDDGKQMMLLAPAVMAFLGMPIPVVKNPVVLLALRHHPQASEDLYLREMDLPPAETQKGG